MLRVLKQELSRALLRPYPYLGLLCCLTVYAISFSSSTWIGLIFYHSGSWVHMHNAFLLEFNPMKTLLPVAAVLPCCLSVAEDWEHHACYWQINRCSYASYWTAKFACAGILGGCVLCLGLWCFLFFTAAFVPAAVSGTYYEEFAAGMIKNEQWMLYYLYFGSLQFLLGFVLSGLGCIAAVITNKKGMILVWPVLLPAIMEIITGFTLIGLSGGQQAIVLGMKKQTAATVYLIIAGILTIGIIVTAVVFRLLLKRRLFQWQ